MERSAVLGYRFVSWLLRTLPPGPTGAVLGLGSQASYLLWPTKRTGRTGTSGTSWGCRRTIRASGGWPCARTANTAATWSS